MNCCRCEKKIVKDEFAVISIKTADSKTQTGALCLNCKAYLDTHEYELDKYLKPIKA